MWLCAIKTLSIRETQSFVWTEATQSSVLMVSLAKYLFKLKDAFQANLMPMWFAETVF